jgi:Transcriptional Coactivator p15 (PC4)
MATLTQEAVRRNSSRSNADEVEPILIAEWPINRREIARVSIECYRGSWLINLRKWYEDETGKFNPGNKGIALSVVHLRRIGLAMNEAIEVARSRGLIPADQEGDR